MTGRDSYKSTLFDREGPDAGIKVRSYSYAAIAGGVSVPMFAAFAVKYGLSGGQFIALLVCGPPLFTLVVAKLALRGMRGVDVVGHAILGGTSSTPYVEQYSYQQTLVMQGRVTEALESYEAIIAEPDSTVDVRMRAVELYVRETKNYRRAAELLQDVLRHPACQSGEEIYAANRLADLLGNHLGEPGRALVQLRRLADRYAGTPAGDRAREAIRVLKSLPHRDDETTPGPAVRME